LVHTCADMQRFTQTHIGFIKAWICTIEALVAILLTKWLYWIVPLIDEEMPQTCIKTVIDAG